MVEFTTEHKQAVVAAPPEEADEYADEFDEPAEGLRLHCYMFLHLHGTTAQLVKQCRRSIILTEADANPTQHGWYYWGGGWLCPVCKLAADRAWDRYNRRVMGLAEVRAVFG